MKSVENYRSKAFKHSVRTFKWDTNNELVCKLNNPNGNTIYIQNRESTWFSTNARVLLGRIYCTFIGHSSGYSFSLNANITVIEYNDQSFVTNHTTRILYAGTVNYKNGASSYGPSISLPQPIVVQPERMYEIRLEAMSSVNCLRHFSTWKSKVQLDDEVTITIHQHPSESNNSQRGSVAVLHFNRI